MLQHYSNRFSKPDLFIDHKELSSTKAGNGAIFTCAGISFALIWGKKSVFSVGSHSLNSEGCHNPNGQSVLLEFSSFTFLNSFILKYFEELFDNSLPYDILYRRTQVKMEHFVNSYLLTYFLSLKKIKTSIYSNFFFTA